MAGNTLNIAASGSLVSNGTTGAVSNTCTITGSGNWIVQNTGNVHYGNDALAPTISNYTGQLILNNTTATRWMAQQAFYTGFGTGTIDVSENCQVWIPDNTTVNATLNLHDPTGCYDGLGLIRFDASNSSSSINGKIILNGTFNYRISVRKDNRTSTGTINGVISGSGGLVYAVGSNWGGTHSTLCLTAANTYAGTTTINEGTLELTGNGTLGTGGVTVNLNSTTFTDASDGKTYKQDDGVLRFNKTSDYTLTQTVSGTGFIEQIGSGGVTFSGSLSGFTGTFTQKAGTVTFTGDATAFGTGATYVYQGGSVAGTSVSVSTLNVQTGTYTAAAFNALSQGTFNAATAVIGAGATVNAATYEDLTSVLNHTVVNGGTFNYTGSDAYVITENKNYTGTETISVPAYLANSTTTSTLTVAAGVTETFSNTLSGIGQNLIKDGAGTLVIAGARYTGETIVNAGTLQITGSVANLSDTTSKLTIAEGATVVLTDQYATSSSTPPFIPISGNGTLQIQSSTKLDVTNVTIGDFTGTIDIAGTGIRLRAIELQQYDNCNININSGSQLWVNEEKNVSVDVTLAGTGDKYDSRGALRFDKAFNSNGKMSNLTGTVTLAADSRIATIAADSAGVGMISGKITGNFALTKNEGYTIASNPLNAQLILTGTNDYGATNVETGTLRLGYTGSVNGKAYDGSTGTLGTGKLTVASVAAFDYCRTDATGYDFAGGVENSGQVNVKSGLFKTSSGAVTNKGTWNISAGATYESASNFTSKGTFTNTGTLNVTGGTFTSQSVFANTGTVNVKSGARLNFDSITFSTGTAMINVENGGFLGISASADASFKGNVHLASGGKLTMNNHTLTRDAVFTGKGTIAITATSSTDQTTFANVDAFEGTITLDSTGVASRLMFSGQTINLGEKATLHITDTGQIYLSNNTSFTANIQLNRSTGYQGDTDYQAGIRSDGGNNNRLYGTLELLDSETWIAARNSAVGNALYIYSDVSGAGGLVKHDTDTDSTIYLAGDTAYDGNTKVNAGNITVGDGTNAARMQAKGSITALENANFNVNSNATLSVGSDTDTTGQTLTFTGAGNVNLDGQLEISIFGESDFDKVDFTGLTGTVDTTDAVVYLDMEKMGELDVAKVYTFDWATGLDSNTFASVLLSPRYSDWVAMIGNNGVVTFGSSSALPEPGSWTLLLLGVGMLLRRKINGIDN